MCDCEAPRVSVVVRSCLTVTVLEWAPSFQNFTFSTFVVVFFVFNHFLWIEKAILEYISLNSWWNCVVVFPPNSPNPLDFVYERAPSLHLSSFFLLSSAPFLFYCGRENKSSHSGEDNIINTSSIFYEYRRELRSADRGRNTFHTTDGLTNYCPIQWSICILKKKQLIDIFFVSSLCSSKKYLIREKNGWNDPPLFSISFLVTHTQTFSAIVLSFHFFSPAKKKKITTNKTKKKEGNISNFKLDFFSGVWGGLFCV